MACVALTSLMRTLELVFLPSNPRLILKDKEHIESLCEKLGFLQTFLDESEKKADNCEELNDLIAKIRDVALEAEDDIEAEQEEDDDPMMIKFRLALKAQHDIEAEVVEDDLMMTKFRLALEAQYDIDHQTLDLTLRCVLQDVEQLIEMIVAFTAKSLQTQHPESSSSGGQSSSQPTSKCEDMMVGQTKEFEEFKEQLLSLNASLQVMCLVGMGGIGKTTFARKLADDSAIKCHFYCCGWATMSQEYNKRQVLLQLCRSVMSPTPNDINSMKDDELAEQLRKSLLGQRYLIILDDIWTRDAWDDVKRCFPAESTSSRVLLTTRHKEVADYACLGKLPYDMRFLNSDESWNLFWQKILVKECWNNEFETVGRKIVESCRGLPLTVVVLAGHLSTNMEVSKWKTVESTLNTLVNLDFSDQFSRIFSLSYNNLPCPLKACFLYLGAFPEDSVIPIKKLIRLWTAEGFIKEVSQKTLEEVGEVYLHELINRSLIMISARSSDGKTKTCRMHDILHELCASKAKNEKLLWTKDETYYYGRKLLVNNRWLSFKGVSSDVYLSVDLNKCYSILFFDMYTFPARDWGFNVSSFKMLRVLDVNGIEYDGEVPLDIVGAVLLRYLALSSNMLLTSIPVSKNKNLQTLRGHVNGTHKLPHGIWDLPQLRHLQFYQQLSIYNPEVVQVNLQTIYWLPSFQCTNQVFLRIPNVKELGIIAQGIKHHCCLDNLNCLNQLEKLKVQGTYRPIELPTQADSFPENLKNITFSKTLFPWKAMNVISKLPNLEVLKLKNHACVGQEWELTEEGGFRRLKHLLISVTNLKDWKDVVENPIPVLEHLVLRNCCDLKEMPSWMDSIDTLKSIQLEHCYASLVSSARTIKEDKSDYGGELEILEFHTQSDEDQKNSETDDEIEEDQQNSDAQSLWIEARSLRISWVENPEYWRWISESGRKAVELRKVCWLDISGTVDTKCLRRMTNYSGYLIFKLKSNARHLDTALASVKYLKDMKSNSQHFHVFLTKSRFSRDFGRFPDCRLDGWMEIKLGDFYVSSGNEGEVEMRLWNTKDMSWKSGLIVRGIEIRSNCDFGILNICCMRI